MNFIRFITIPMTLIGLCLTGSATASIQHNNAEKSFIADIQLYELHETSRLAEQIWNRLTNEFVTLFEAGNFIEAATTAKVAYQLAERSFGTNHINTADSILKLGIANESLGNFNVAKDHMIGALVILEEQLGPMHEDVAVVYTNLANLEFEQSNQTASERYHQAALEIRRFHFGDKDPSVAQSLYNLAVLYDDAQEYGKAQDYYEAALKIWHTSYGTTHPYIANALNNLANVYSSIGDNASAVKTHKQSLEVRRRLYGAIHPEVARSLINLGKLYVKISEYEKAKPIYTEAVNVAEKLFGQSHPQVAMLLYSLANIYHIQGRMDSSNMSSVKVSTTAASISADNNSGISQEYFQKALPLYERALTILDKTIGTNHPAVVAMLSEMAMLYKSVGKRGKAEKMQARISSQVQYHNK